MKTKLLLMGLLIILIIACKKEEIWQPDRDYISLYAFARPGTIDSVYAIFHIHSNKTGNISLKIYNKRSGIDKVREYSFTKDSQDSIRVFQHLSDWPYDYRGEITFTSDEGTAYSSEADFKRYENGVIQTGPDFFADLDSVDFGNAYLSFNTWDSWNSGKIYVNQISVQGNILKTDSFVGYNGVNRRKLIITGVPGVDKLRIGWNLGDYNKYHDFFWDPKKVVIKDQSLINYNSSDNSYTFVASMLVNTNKLEYVNVKSISCLLPDQYGGSSEFVYNADRLLALQNPITHNWILGMPVGSIITPNNGFEVGKNYRFYFKMIWDEQVLTPNPVNKIDIDTFNIQIRDWVANERLDTLKRGADSLGLVIDINKGEMNVNFKVYNGATLIDDISYLKTSLDTIWYVKKPNPTHFVLTYYKAWNNVKGISIQKNMNWNAVILKKKK